MIELVNDDLSLFKKEIVIRGARSEIGICFLDSGAPLSLVDEKMAERVNATRLNREIEVKGIFKESLRMPLVEVVIEVESHQIKTQAGVYPLRDLVHVDFLAGWNVFRFLTERLGLFGRIITWIIIGLLIAIPWYASLPVEIIKVSSSLSSVVIWLPILVIIGMNWIRWWAVKFPKLPFESS